MLKDEQEEKGRDEAQFQPFTYGDYLRVPELLSLQTPLKEPSAHDEMLFIITQQIQELWFKQVLHEVKASVELIERGEIMEAVRLLHRVNKIIRIVGNEVEALATMPPQEFHKFRHVLTTSSGFESEQFRELELASGLSDPTFFKLVAKFMDLDALRARWPVTLHDALLDVLARVDRDPASALVCVYSDSTSYMELYWLAEALSEYEVLFSEWRVHHIKVVERTIGDLSPGTGGTTGSGYLGKTLSYKFFPELWEARNRMTKASSG